MERERAAGLQIFSFASKTNTKQTFSKKKYTYMSKNIHIWTITISQFSIIEINFPMNIIKSYKN